MNFTLRYQNIKFSLYQNMNAIIFCCFICFFKLTLIKVKLNILTNEAPGNQSLPLTSVKFLSIYDHGSKNYTCFKLK